SYACCSRRSAAQLRASNGLAMIWLWDRLWCWPPDAVKHLLEHGDEGFEIVCGNVAEERGGALLPFGMHARGRRCALFGQGDKCCAPICRVRTARHPALGFEVVNESSHIARRAAECLAKFPLDDGSPLVQHEEHLGTSRAQTTLTQVAFHQVAQACRQLEDAVERHDTRRHLRHVRPAWHVRHVFPLHLFVFSFDNSLMWHLYDVAISS